MKQCNMRKRNGFCYLSLVWSQEGLSELSEQHMAMNDLGNCIYHFLTSSEKLINRLLDKVSYKYMNKDGKKMTSHH